MRSSQARERASDSEYLLYTRIPIVPAVYSGHKRKRKQKAAGETEHAANKRMTLAFVERGESGAGAGTGAGTDHIRQRYQKPSSRQQLYL